MLNENNKHFETLFSGCKYERPKLELNFERKKKQHFATLGQWMYLRVSDRRDDEARKGTLQ